MSLSCCLFDQSKPMYRHQWAQLQNRGREGEKKKEKEGRKRGVKGIYCQEPSISGNGYACIGVNQTCCFSSSLPGVKEKNKKGASLRGINRKLMFQHLRLKI